VRTAARRRAGSPAARSQAERRADGLAARGGHVDRPERGGTVLRHARRPSRSGGRSSARRASRSPAAARTRPAASGLPALEVRADEGADPARRQALDRDRAPDRPATCTERPSASVGGETTSSAEAAPPRSSRPFPRSPRPPERRAEASSARRRSAAPSRGRAWARTAAAPAATAAEALDPVTAANAACRPRSRRVGGQQVDAGRDEVGLDAPVEGEPARREGRDPARGVHGGGARRSHDASRSGRRRWPPGARAQRPQERSRPARSRTPAGRSSRRARSRRRGRRRRRRRGPRLRRSGRVVTGGDERDPSGHLAEAVPVEERAEGAGAAGAATGAATVCKGETAPARGTRASSTVCRPVRRTSRALTAPVRSSSVPTVRAEGAPPGPDTLP
jgi:hypothetical protein